MEIYIITNGFNSLSIKERLNVLGVSSVYTAKEINFMDLMVEKGYKPYKNGMFEIIKPNDEIIAVYADVEETKSIFSILFNISEEMTESQFDFKEQTITKFWIQNYAEGYSAARLIFLNDNSHNFKEV